MAERSAGLDVVVMVALVKAVKRGNRTRDGNRNCHPSNSQQFFERTEKLILNFQDLK